MAKLNGRGSVAGSGTIFKVFVPPSSSGQVAPPSAINTDGTLTTNGSGSNVPVQVTRITCVAAGVVALYDANASGSIAAANEIWTKTVAAGDIYVVDSIHNAGGYVTTDGTARVVLMCC